LNLLYVLAQTATHPAPSHVDAPFWANPQQWFLPLMIGMVLLMIMNSGRGKKAEAKKREELLKSLKRGDRVRTIGGIFGTVVDVRDADVVLKVDESVNAKIKFAREAILKVITDEDNSSTDKQ